MLTRKHNLLLTCWQYITCTDIHWHTLIRAHLAQVALEAIRTVVALVGMAGRLSSNEKCKGAIDGGTKSNHTPAVYAPTCAQTCMGTEFLTSTMIFTWREALL